MAIPPYGTLKIGTPAPNLTAGGTPKLIPAGPNPTTCSMPHAGPNPKAAAKLNAAGLTPKKGAATFVATGAETNEGNKL